MPSTSAKPTIAAPQRVLAERPSSFLPIVPPYYLGKDGLQPRHVVADWDLNYNVGTALVYVLRAGRKDPILKDLEKARAHLIFARDDGELTLRSRYVLNKSWRDVCSAFDLYGARADAVRQIYLISQDSLYSRDALGDAILAVTLAIAEAKAECPNGPAAAPAPGPLAPALKAAPVTEPKQALPAGYPGIAQTGHAHVAAPSSSADRVAA